MRFVVSREHDNGAMTRGTRQRDHVSQIELFLSIVVFDTLEKRERNIAPDRHQAGVAEGDGAFGFARVLVLADGPL